MKYLETYATAQNMRESEIRQGYNFTNTTIILQEFSYIATYTDLFLLLLKL